MKEKEFIVLFALLTSLTALSIDAVLPAFPAMAQTLAIVNFQDTQLIISALVLGMAGGELVFGPLSDSIGRKAAILLGIAIYLLGCLLALSADSLSALLLGRVVQGIGIAGPKIASRALIRDLYKGAAMARIMSFVMMIFILVPMLAPAFGQFILTFGDWHLIFVAFVLQALIASVWLIIRQPETLPKEQRIAFSLGVIYTNARWILQHRQVMSYTLTAGMVFGSMMLYLSTAQSIFQDLYQTGRLFPWYFALLSLGAGVAGLVNGKLVVRLGMQRLTRAALIAMVLISMVLLIVTRWHQGVPPLGIFLGLGVAMFFCKGLIFGNINALAMEHLGAMAGIGASIIASVSSLVAIGLSYGVGRFYSDSLYPLGCGFLISASVALCLVEYAARLARENTSIR